MNLHIPMRYILQILPWHFKKVICPETSISKRCMWVRHLYPIYKPPVIMKAWKNPLYIFRKQSVCLLLQCNFLRSKRSSKTGNFYRLCFWCFHCKGNTSILLNLGSPEIFLITNTIFAIYLFHFCFFINWIKKKRIHCQCLIVFHFHLLLLLSLAISF